MVMPRQAIKALSGVIIDDLEQKWMCTERRPHGIRHAGMVGG